MVGTSGGRLAGPTQQPQKNLPSAKPMKIDFRYGKAICEVPWTVVFGIVTGAGVELGALEEALSICQDPGCYDSGPPSAATRRMNAFESFFTQNGFCSPLAAQLTAVQKKGLPPANPFVRALLMSEVRTGILMGVQDSAAIKGPLICDVARQGESFPGMRGEIRCQEGEIVLRDSDGIIATLLQGPDRRTRITKSTRDVAFFIFSVPGIDIADVNEGVDAVQSLLKPACNLMSTRIYGGQGSPVAT